MPLSLLWPKIKNRIEDPSQEQQPGTQTPIFLHPHPSTHRPFPGRDSDHHRAVFRLMTSKAQLIQAIEALEAQRSIGYPRLRWEIHEALAQYHDQVGNPEKATRHRQGKDKIVAAIADGLEDKTLTIQPPM